MRQALKSLLPFTALVLFALYSVNLYAQQTRTLNNKQYEFSSNKWYQVENGKRYEVNASVITVKMKEGIASLQTNALHNSQKAQVLRTNILGYSDLKISIPGDVFQVVQNYLNSGLAETAELNTFGEYVATPNDTYFSDQWALNNTGQTGGTTDADIDAVEAWDISVGSSSVIVGILDSGTDWVHEDLDGNIYLNSGEDAWSSQNNPATGNGIDDDDNGLVDDWKGWDFYNGNNDSRGPYFHGTHVAGVVGAETNNNVGIAGVAGGWNSQGARLLIAGVGDSYPDGSVLDDAILYAASQGAKIITMSLTVGQTAAIDNALATAYSSYGCFIDCAAGNTDGDDVTYPATNQYVVAVTATDHNDSWASYSALGSEVSVSAPGSNIYSTQPSNSYGSSSGTSFAAPNVAGVASLVKSVNSNLTPAQIKTILEQSAEDKATAGRDDYYGYGRVNAYQAVLLALAYANKSTGAGTGQSGDHVLEHGLSGKYHEIFMGGGEVFYRRSTNGGSSWDITKRVTTGNGSNESPSIVAGYGYPEDNLRAVWQRKLDTYHYEIWNAYSTNGGATWSMPAIVNGCSNVTVSYEQSSANWGPGATPVIGSFFYSGYEGTPSYLLVYAAQEGLHYHTAQTATSSWSASSIVPGSEGYYDEDAQTWYCSDWYPCLASYNSEEYRVNLIYDDRWNHVYSQIFDMSNEEGWGSRSVVEYTGTYPRYSSVALDYNNNALAVYSTYNGTHYVAGFRRGYADNTWSSWHHEWLISNVESYAPVVSYYYKGGLNSYGVDILWYTSNQQMYQRKLDVGDSWYEYSLGSGYAPNITHERSNSGNPKHIWTDLSASPYLLALGSQNLPKVSSPLATGELRRAAEIADITNNSRLRVEFSQPVITTSSGTKQVVQFKEYDYTGKFALTTENIFDYLQTEEITIPADAKDISYTVAITASSPDTLALGKLNSDKKTGFIAIDALQQVKEKGASLLGSDIVSLNDTKGLHAFTKTIFIPVSSLCGKTVSLAPQVLLAGTFDEKNLVFGLVNISISGESSGSERPDTPTALAQNEYLGQNYPNPFNPVTNFAYRVTEMGKVSLKVFDALGREVAVLVNDVKSKGEYVVQFNASTLASGIYFYRLQTGGITETKKFIVTR